MRRHAASDMSGDERIILDAGTTTLQVAKSLSQRKNVTALTNALPVAARAQAGKVFLVEGALNKTYLDEVCEFTGDPKATLKDDQVDGTTIAYRGAQEPTFGFKGFDE